MRWAERIKIVTENAEKTSEITNHPLEGKAAVSALEIAHLLSGEKVKIPRR